jgi:hypothetical protein
MAQGGGYRSNPGGMNPLNGGSAFGGMSRMPGGFQQGPTNPLNGGSAFGGMGAGSGWQPGANVQAMFPGMGQTRNTLPMMAKDGAPADGFGGQPMGPANSPPPPPFLSSVPPADPNGPQYGSPLNAQNPLWDRYASMIGNPATRAQGLALYRQSLDAQRMPIGSENGGGQYAPINLTRRA